MARSTLKFSKMHGLGNDFMVIDAIKQHFVPEPKQIKSWANRHTGIGFDQMLIVEETESEAAAFRYRIFNADGGEVSQCGNGARCFARFVRERQLTSLDIIPVETNAGLLELELINATQVRVNMGIPQFEPEQIPIACSTTSLQYQLEVAGRKVVFSALAIGNPHIVIQVDDVDNAAVETVGAALEAHVFFPQRVNVGFIQVLDRRHFKLRVFERGVGETQACGSGACAAMVAGVQLGLLDTRVEAQLTGGELKLEWQGMGNPVMMTGETALVFEGEIEYE